ncbi:MAG: type II secretion system protein GspE, partial [Proteobacteria bacterium]|nr:type II secretion system protein GspE [Pseudomonadota bacterium]
MIDSSYRIGASDIHIDPRKDTILIRFRVDGVLERYREIPAVMLPELVARVK